VIIARNYFNRGWCRGWWLLIKTSRLLKRGRQMGGGGVAGNGMGWKRILACRSRALSPEEAAPRNSRRGGRRRARVRKGSGQREEQERKRERKGREKASERIRALDYGGRILLITGVLRGRETKRFPFNCAPRPVHSAIVLSKNLITGAYGRYPADAAPPSCRHWRCNYA